MGIMNVVDADYGSPRYARKFYEGVINDLLLRQVRMGSQLKIKILLPEYILIFADKCLCSFSFFCKYRPGNFSVQATGKRHKSVGICSERRLVYAGLIIEA